MKKYLICIALWELISLLILGIISLTALELPTVTAFLQWVGITFLVANLQFIIHKALIENL